MKILFLTIGQVQSLEEKSVHIDLIKALVDAGHKVSVCATREKRLGLPTDFAVENGVKILRLKIGNLTKCSIIEKGINTLKIERQYITAIKKYFKNDSFDLVIYNTPPITLANVVKYCKNKYKCKSYLMLKDIFPQNAIDIGLMTKKGIMGLMYKFFRSKEIKLYKQSDRIGCMSQANIDYLLKHNPYINSEKVEIFPNAVYNLAKQNKDKTILDKLGVDSNKVTFIYGGNLGRPQGLDFFAKALKETENVDCNFIIVGSGQDKEKLFNEVKDIKNVYTFDYLPHDEYSKLCASCDIGIIMLDYRFSIPNYPSRILSYMENTMAVLACTDKATDIKELVESEANCGKWCYSNDLKDFKNLVEWFVVNKEKIAVLGENGYNYLSEKFIASICIEKLNNMELI